MEYQTAQMLPWVLDMMLEISREKTGSVGASWPPRYDAHNSRVKGFCTRAIESREDARVMLQEARDVEASSPGATRTTIRAFVRQGLVEELRGAEGFSLEARFDASNAVAGHELAYFGRNTGARMPDAESFERELESVSRLVWGVGRTDLQSASLRVAASGYSLSRLNGNGLFEVDRLLELYREAYAEYTFDLTPQTVSGMLSNGNIVIVGRDRESQVVSSLIAEHVELALEHGRTIHLYELSDYATFRAHRGNGLITLMQMEAINSIRALPHGQEAVVYAEDRAAWMAVNKSSQRAGMTFSGTLMQHCVLVSDRDFGETGRFENLNVWAHIPSRGV